MLYLSQARGPEQRGSWDDSLGSGHSCHYFTSPSLSLLICKMEQVPFLLGCSEGHACQPRRVYQADTWEGPWPGPRLRQHLPLCLLPNQARFSLPTVCQSPAPRVLQMRKFIHQAALHRHQRASLKSASRRATGGWEVLGGLCQLHQRLPWRPKRHRYHLCLQDG